MFNKLKNLLSKKTPVIFVDCESLFDEVVEEIFEENIIAIDTEFNWRNTYFPQLSLMQIATPKKIFLLDCLKLISLFKIKKVLENNKILKIFHAARSDVTVLSCTLNIKVVNSFDIQIAEKFISRDDLWSYAKIVSKYISLKIDKSETNSNWLRRPLTQSQKKYAANDVRYLIKIYEKQKNILEKKSSYFIVKDSTKREVILGSQELYVPRLKKLKSHRKIEKDLFMWRENMAIEKNVPPSFIFKDKYFKKILKIYDENISKDTIYEILKNEKLANSLMEHLK